MNETENNKDTYETTGDELLRKVKELIREGNVRKITIRDKEGNVIIVIPVTVGVIGAVIAPVLAAVGAIAALITECSISVERSE